MKTVEDCIEILAGIQVQQGTFSIDRSDYNLIHSLARQTFRGTAYTDRQYELAKQKVISYRAQFENNGYDIDAAIESIRFPLRSIDRSRWVKIVEKDGNLLIAVRFVFQKKLISQIDKIKTVVQEEYYDKQEKIHYFTFSEKNLYEIINVFNKNNNFGIPQELKDYYDELDYMNNNKKDFIPGIYNLKLKNLHDKNLSYAMSTIGEPSFDNLSRYYDQRHLYNLKYFDEEDVKHAVKNLTTLTQRIIHRTKHQVLVNANEFTFANLAESMLELYRFPLLIILNEKTCYDELVNFHRSFNGIIPNKDCSVMFRLENNVDGAEFNQYIQNNNLNNPIDNHTKIVYISSNKLPKPLLKAHWQPSAALFNKSDYAGRHNKVDTFVANLDLVLYYDDDISPWKRNAIEKI